MNIFLSKIGAVIGGGLLFLSSFLGTLGNLFENYSPPKHISAGDIIYQQPGLFETSLSASMDSTQTSSTLVSATLKSGALLAGNFCFTVDSGLTTTEFMCGVASGTSVTGLIRGIGEDGKTSYSSLQFAHRYGADVKVTDFPSNQRIVSLLSGSSTFPNVLSYATSVTRTAIANSTSDIPTVDYVNSVASSGAPAATTGVGGLVILGTQAQLQTGVATGSYLGTTYNLVPQNVFFSSTSTATTTVPVTQTNGTLSNGFISTSSPYTWAATSTFASSTIFNGTTTFNGASTFSATTTLASTTSFTGTVTGIGKLVDASNTTVSAVSTTATTTIVSVTVPGGTLLGTREVGVVGKAFVNSFGANNVAGGTVKIQLFYGSVLVASSTINGVGATYGGTSNSGSLDFGLFSNASSAQEWGYLKVNGDSAFTGNNVSSTIQTGTLSVDATVNQTLQVQVTNGASDSNTGLIEKSYVVQTVSQ